MTTPDPDLRDRLIAALSKAGAYCGECNFEPGDVGCADCQRCHGWYVDAVLGIVQPELDQREAERDTLRAEAQAYLHQPVLRHCVYPACLREFDMAASMEGRVTRPTWSSKGWLQVHAAGGYVCPEHAATVRDQHTPRWLTTGKYLACACGWESTEVRWRGYGIEAWKDHLLWVDDIAALCVPDILVAAGFCGDRLTGWVCTLPPGRHPDWRHSDGEHWWTQTRCPADCGQPNTEHHCTKET